MKRTILLSMAAYAGAASLRGEGVEEIGEQIEHFPPKDHRMVDRRTLTEDVAMIEIYDEWPDRDVVGNVVEDVDEVYVEMYVEDEDAHDENETTHAYARDPDQHAIDAEFIAKNGNRSEWYDDGDDADEHVEYAPRTTKQYIRDPNSLPLVGNDLTGKSTDQYDRREATCDESKSEFQIEFTTDRYAYENRWALLNVENGETIATGPPDGYNYVDRTEYTGQWCLPPGKYKFQMIDRGLDGICSNNPIFGCGKLELVLNGQDAGKLVSDESDWQTRDFQFYVAASTSRIDGVDNNYVGAYPDYCEKVRSVMEEPPWSKGVCTLPNGRRGHRVRVTTKVDNYGRETSWTITEKESNAMRMKMEPIIPANQERAVEDCLPDGKYNLRFQDLDGVCCRHGQGYFKLAVNGRDLLDGGAFQGAIDHDFQLGFDWISTMSERDCEWWWAHDYRRRDWHTRCYEGQYCDKDYRHLKWSPTLRADAQVYANKLLDTCTTTGIKHDNTDQGENLAKNKGSGLWGGKYPADKVTKRFVDNEEFWGWNDNAHLTQAMWYSSRYVGCADSVKNMGRGRWCRMQVCRYAKAGNCSMGKYDSEEGNNWMTPMMMDDSPCGPMCASQDGCYH
mmetsp:Transcript_1008/g.1833  ORF Transcript_1008/g.1833 Transcript_1008/m.1833 type:complete len:618 (+) Transcript_1008:333-2186(+)|eukprot:CAMPEP_0201641224 /NCGR_PEP_ID=MMETSP0493-20130528/23600_1 /ASSEMBLY_ACC=CAM_ASM_000838 /TAXON_ID=420259 /ORGANISM="Thalassiosira gravida, Strain GMp14c1" /LENGTH=617 /DNA_ID=CAMNT_0048115095 /DNA_START=271 /DNA_END=2124 /DNA_ORIENTATION=-